MSARKFQFYIVPTPIGNINDITLRAIEILKEVDLIACEDTRVTQKLLNHYNISKKCISYHKYNEKDKVEFLINEIKSGKTLALVSDAGTPMICDPGCVIIDRLIKENISYTSLPGASAVTTFLSSIPRGGEEFTFVGFIPRIEKQIQEIAQKNIDRNFIFYDSPERIIKTLTCIQKVRPTAKVALARELTKLFEEVKVGVINDVLNYFKNEIKGEIVCMIYADDSEKDFDLITKINSLKSKGYKDKDISIILSTLYDVNKNEVYKIAIKS